MEEQEPAQTHKLGAPVETDRVFRPSKKGVWHLQAHLEYGVIWSHCGIRAMVKDCQRPKEPVYLRDLCGTCARKAKEELGRTPQAAG